MVIDEELGLCLEHHGIDGQKWGHRNGPPYPLDPNKDYSKAELRALKKESRKEFRKEYRKFKKYKKRQAKEDEARKKAEAEAMIEEEKKQHAIASGSASEVDKYKDKMTTQELNDAMNRVRAFQSLESLKMSEVKSATDKINDEVNRITAENNLAKAKLQEKYGPGKGEYALEKTARISEKLGKIAKAANDIGIATRTWQGVYEKANKLRTKTDKKEEVNAIKEESNNKSNNAKAIKGLKWGKRDEEIIREKVSKKAQKEWNKFTNFVEKEKNRFDKVKVKNMGVDRSSTDEIIDAVFDSDVMSTKVSMLPALRKNSSIITI